MKNHLVLATLVGSFVLGGCVYADRPHDDRGYGPGPQVTARFMFTDRERIYLTDHYHRNPPHGWGRGRMPPGHAKRLARGAPWPPGAAYEPLPPHLERHLQPLPRGYARFIVGPDVVIVDLGARVVLDGFRIDF